MNYRLRHYLVLEQFDARAIFLVTRRRTLILAEAAGLYPRNMRRSHELYGAAPAHGARRTTSSDTSASTTAFEGGGPHGRNASKIWRVVNGAACNVRMGIRFVHG